MENLNQSIILYHANCSDGLMAAYSAKTKLEMENNQTHCFPLSHNILNIDDCDLFLTTCQTNLSIDLLSLFNQSNNHETTVECTSTCTSTSATATTLYLLDISLTVGLYIELLKRFPNIKIVVIDHHKTSFENIVQLIEQQEQIENFHNLSIYFNLNYSAAALSYMYFYDKSLFNQIFKDKNDINAVKLPFSKEINQGLPLPIQCVQEMDLYRFDDDLKPFTRPYGSFFRNKVNSLEDCHDVMSNGDFLIKGCDILRNSHFQKQIEIGQTMNEMFALQVKSLVNENNSANEIAFMINGEKHLGYIVNVNNMFASEVGYHLCRLDENHKFAITYAIRYNNNGHSYGYSYAPYLKCSIRSTDDYDCSIIAKHFNGGGHPQASGFTTPLSYLDSFINSNETNVIQIVN